MQNRHDSHKGIKELFSDPRIPQHIDVTEKVMNRIQSPKERFLVKYKVSLLVAIGLFASVTTAYAAAAYFQLQNQQGEVIYQEKDASEAPNTEIKAPDEQMLALMQRISEIEEQMAPGTVAAVYIKENNPNKKIHTIAKPFAFDKLEDLQNKLAGTVVLPDSLPGGFAFANGSVEYEVNRDYHKEELYKLAEASDQDFVQQPLQWTDQLSHVVATYKAGEDSMRVAITNLEGVTDNTVYYANQDGRKTEKIVVDQIEALYAEQKGQERVNKTIMWVVEKGKAKLEYRISSASPQLDREKAKLLIQAFLTAQ